VEFEAHRELGLGKWASYVDQIGYAYDGPTSLPDQGEWSTVTCSFVPHLPRFGSPQNVRDPRFVDD
jgi:hypothetical protein